MKTVCILLALSVAVISAVPITEDVQQQYINGDPNDLFKPLDDIIAEIKEEEKEDQQRVDEDAAAVKVKEAEEAAALGRLKAAEKIMNGAHKNLDTQQTLENKREEEYATNNEVRAKELVGMTEVEKEIKKIVDTGPADGTMGVLAKSKVITLLQKLSDQFGRPEYKNTINNIQSGRTGSETTSMFADVKKARAAIDKEDKQDQAEVKVERKKTRELRLIYDDKKASYETSTREHNESAQRTIISKDALAATKKDKAEADKLRAEEIKVIADAKEKVKELIAVRKPKSQQSMLELQLNNERANSATEKLKAILKTLRADVNLEEKTQLAILNRIKAMEKAAREAMEAAETKWNAQKIATKAAYKKFESAHGEWEGSEMALAQEQAVAEQERKVIGEVRGMIKKLEAASLKTLGNCPMDKNGAPCSGQGVCEKEKNGLGARCKCTGYGKTGYDCGLCKFGYKDVNGACTKVFETAVSFIQMEGKDYSADDMNDLIEQLQAGRVNKKEQSGIEKLLRQLEDKLDAQEKLLIEEATKAKDVRDIFDKHWNANKTQEAADKKDYEMKKIKHKKIYKKLTIIQAMYDFEHPLRMKELEIITLLDNIILKLEGKKVHSSTPAPSNAVVKSNFKTTSAPTTA